MRAADRFQNLGESFLLCLDVLLVLGGVGYTLAQRAEDDGASTAVELSLLVLLGLSIVGGGMYLLRQACNATARGLAALSSKLHSRGNDASRRHVDADAVDEDTPQSYAADEDDAPQSSLAAVTTIVAFARALAKTLEEPQQRAPRSDEPVERKSRSPMFPSVLDNLKRTSRKVRESRRGSRKVFSRKEQRDSLDRAQQAAMRFGRRHKRGRRRRALTLVALPATSFTRAFALLCPPRGATGRRPSASCIARSRCSRAIPSPT